MLLGFAAPGGSQEGIEGHSAGGRAEIPKLLGYGGKLFLSQVQLLGKDLNNSGIGLMRGQTLQRGHAKAAA
jgi:hypothetical protein